MFLHLWNIFYLIDIKIIRKFYLNYVTKLNNSSIFAFIIHYLFLGIECIKQRDKSNMNFEERGERSIRSLIDLKGEEALGKKTTSNFPRQRQFHDNKFSKTVNNKLYF